MIDLDFSDLVALWGSFRCVVCPLERGSMANPALQQTAGAFSVTRTSRLTRAAAAAELGR